MAARAASIAVLPPPMTTTFLPRSRLSGAFLAFSRNSMTFISSPYSMPALPLCQAPVARMTWV